MATYENVRTGAILETECGFSGSDWKKVGDEGKKPKKAPKETGKEKAKE